MFTLPYSSIKRPHYNMISFKNPFHSTHWLILQRHGTKQKVMRRKKENYRVCRPLIHQGIRPGMQTFIQPSDDNKRSAIYWSYGFL